MREDIRALLPIWDDWMLKAFGAFVGLGIMIYLYKVVRLALIKDNKDKYDFAFEHELNLIRYSVLSGVVGVALISNTVATEFVYANPTMFFFRLFITNAVSSFRHYSISQPIRIKKQHFVCSWWDRYRSTYKGTNYIHFYLGPDLVLPGVYQQNV